MSTLSEYLGGPIAQAGGAIFGLLTNQELRESRPTPPQLFTQRSGGLHPGYGGPSYYMGPGGEPAEPYPGMELTDEQARLFGVARGGTLPRPEDINWADVMRASLGDIERGYEAATIERDRQLGAVADYATELEGARGELGEAKEDWAESLAYGEQQFANAGMNLRQTMAQAEQDAARAVETIQAGITEFKGLVDQMQANVASMTGTVLQNAKNQTAALLASVAPAIGDATRANIADTMASMRAQGVPEAQVQAAAAQIAASGQQQIGSMLAQIGGAENARLSGLEKDLAGFEVQAQLAGAAGMAGILQTGMAETAATYRNLGNVRQGVADINARLANEAATWRAGRSNARTELVALSSKVLLGGRMDLFNMLSAIEEPYVQLQPTLVNLLTMMADFEQMEYENEVNYWNQDAALSGNSVQTVQGFTDRMMGLNEADANRDMQRDIAQTQLWSNVAGSALSGGGEALGGYLSRG